jgi:hypothetical protein
MNDAQPVGAVSERVELEPAILQFFLSPQYQASTSSTQQQFSFTEDDRVFIEDLDRLVLSGNMNLETYLLSLEDEFRDRLSETDRDRLYAKLLAERFVPFGDRLSPSAIDVARAESLRLPPVPYYRIYLTPLTYSGVATEIAAAAGVSTMSASTRARLRDLVVDKITGRRVDSQIRDVLTRSADTDGIGLDGAAADRAMTAMQDIVSRATVMSEDAYASWLADQKRQSSVSASTSSPEEVDPEIAAISAKMATAPVNATKLDEAIDATVASLSWTPSDDYMLRRLRNFVSSRLRNVRTRVELKQLLMRDTKVGGMGLDDGKAETIATRVEEGYAKFHDVIAEEEKHKLDVQLEEQKRKIEERRRRETEEHAKWFEEKIRARKAGETKQQQAVEGMRRVFGGVTTPVTAPAHPVDAKEQRLETNKFGPLIPVTPTVPKTASSSTPSSSDFSRPRNAALATRPSLSSSAPAQVKVSPATIQLAQAQASTRPSVDGVVYGGPKLVGPIGELGSMSVAEFRRLSRDPEEAARKIRQKIETLAMESFEKKVEGVRAFQESPLQAAYLSLVGESFRAMRPVAQLADEKRKGGSDTLSPDEIAAIVRLNSALHF